MADINKRLFMNFPGEFFVDSTCINCDACRGIAPNVFAEAEDYAYVKAQPANDEQERIALRALIACPTGSIGTENPNNAAEVITDFPLHLENGIYYCGFNSRKSYGGNSYFIEHPSGNWLIDSPRFHRHLVNRFKEMGGIDFIFLSHRDDVADAEKYAAEFSAQRIIHHKELSAQPDAEIVIHETDPVEFLPDFLVIPTPENPCSHVILLYKKRDLFSGDLLRWDLYRSRLVAPEFSGSSGRKSLATSLGKLQPFPFEYVLPAHGAWMRRSADEMQQHFIRLIRSIRESKLQ